MDDDDEFLTFHGSLPDALGYTVVAATLTITDDDGPATVTLGNETVDEDAGTVTVTATVDVAVPGGFTVDVMTTDGTAEVPGDYTTPTGQTLSFGGTTAGETQTFTVPIVDDNTVEGPETFTVLLGNLGGTTASVDITDTATVTITDNDEPPPPAQEKTATVSFRDSLSASASIRTHLAEGDGDTCQYLAYHVVFDPPIPNARAEYSRWPLNAYQVLFNPPVPHWFKFRFWSDGPLDTATPPEDYHFCGPPNIRPVFEIRDRHLFSSRHLLAIRIVDDAVDDDDEFLTLGINNLPDALGYTVVAATLTITDNDEPPPPPTVTLGNETVDEDAGTVTVTATVDVAVPGGFTVDVMTTDGTAEVPGDYTRPTGQTLSFGGTTAGETQTFTVPIVDDNTVEGPETFTVLLGNLGGTTASVDITDTATVTITDNDEPPPPAQEKTATVSFRDSLSASASIRTHLAEGDDDTCQYLAYHVVFDPPIPNARAVYGVGPGVLARYRPIPHERAVSKYGAGLPPSAYYVLFDPPVPHWFKFRFGAGGPLDSATPPEDYHFCNPPNIRPVFEVRDRRLFSSRHLLAIRIVDDAVDDDDEFLTLNIKNLPDALGYTVVAATLTITDNDEPPPPTVTLGNETVDEDAGTVTVTATVDVAVPGGFTVDVMTTDGTAEAPGDYITPTEQTLSFGGTAGEVQTFTVPIVDDNTAEGPETFTVLLGTLVGTTASVDITDTATVTITDDDSAPTAIVLSFSEAGADEGASPTVTVTAAFPGSVTLTEATVVTVAVGDSGDTASEGADYTTVDDLTVTIEAGATSGTGTFQFAVTDDTVADPGETVTVSGTAGGFSFTNAALAINDNDPVPRTIALSLNPTSLPEGTSATVTVTASFPEGSGTLTSATEVRITLGPGYSFTVTIAAGATSGTGSFPAVVPQNTLVEGDRITKIRGSAGGFIVTPTTLTIIEDDPVPRAIALSLNPTSVIEGTSATVTVTASFPEGSVPLTGATVVTVAVGDSGDTAIEGTDYTTVEDLPVTIAAGAASGTATFQFAVTDDAAADPGETVTVSGTAGGFSFTNAVLAINDNDTAPTAIVLGLSQAGADEGASPTVTVTATLSPAGVTLTEATVVTVAVGDSGDTATEGTDYTPVADLTVTIEAGATSGTGTFQFAPTDDAVADPGEAVTVSGTAGGFSFTNAVLAITDTDTAPTAIVLSLSEVGANEGASPTVTVTATLSPATVTLTDATVVAVAVGDSGDTATEGTDYDTVADLTIIIAAGTTSGTGTFQFAVTDDGVADPGETVSVSGCIGWRYVRREVAHPGKTMSVSDLAGGFSFTDAELAITEIDTAPTAIVLSLSEVGADEGASPTVTVTATLSPATVTLTDATVVAVAVGDSGDTATEGTDYDTVADLTIIIAAGTTRGTGTFQFAVTDDAVADPGETVSVSGYIGWWYVSREVADPGKTMSVSGLAGGFSFTDAELAITDTDTAPTAIVLGLSQAGADEGASPTVTVTATLSPASVTLTADTTVTVAVGAGTDTATEGALYDSVMMYMMRLFQVRGGDTAPEGTDYDRVDDLTITIAAGATSGTGTFLFAATDDTVADPGETVTVSGSAGGFSFTNTALAITDNDTAPTAIVLSLSQAGADEGASPTVTVTATLSPTSVTLPDATVVTVAVGDSEDTATEGTDYDRVDDLTITIEAGAASGTGTFQFASADDAVADPNETVSVSGSAVGFSFTNATLAITDTDIAPTAIALSLSQADADEGASPTVTVTATLSPASVTLTDATVVTVAVGAGTDSAIEGTDYTTVNDLTVTIEAGATSGTGTFQFAPTDDAVADPGEAVTVSGTAGGFAITDLTLAVTDTDIAPTTIVLSLGEVGADEGASPTVTVTAAFPGSVTLTDATVVTVAVGDSTDTATEGTDYDTVAGLTLTIPAGESSVEGTFQFAPADDAIADPNETVSVSGSAVGFSFTNATLAITDTDIAPTAIVLSLSQANADEGASPTVTVTATLSPASVTLTDATVVTVAVGAGTDSAIEGTDYTTVDDLTITIEAGATSGTGTFQFAPTDDAVADAGEVVTVSGTAGGFAITDLTLAVTDTDIAPTAIVLSLSQAGADEGASPTVTVTATLSPAGVTLTEATVVTVAVGADTDTATEGTDYTPVADLTITIEVGATSGTATSQFAPTDDVVEDPGETVSVFGTAVGFSFTNAALTITDTDTAPTAIVLSLSEVGADEGASPTVTVTATLSPASVTLTDATVVTVAVGDSGDAATEGTDYDTVAGLTLTIPAGESSVEGTFLFPVTDDAVEDPGETVSVSGTAVGFSFTNAALTITDTDIAPTAIVLSLSQVGADEGASPTVTVTATLSPASVTLTADTTVTVAVGAGTDTATEGTDYTPVGDLPVIIVAGATSGTGTFQFAVTNDAVADLGETVSVSGTVGEFSFTNAALTINDTDTAPTAIVLSLSEVGADEGASPTVTVTATLSPASVTLTDATVVAVTVGDSGDTATEGTDYTTVDDLTVTIAAGTTSGTGTFEFAPMDDAVVDPGEAVTVSGTAGGFAITDLTLAITDTDVAPTAIVLSLSQAGADEGASPTVTVTATLSPASITLPADITVTVAVGADTDTATEGTGYDSVMMYMMRLFQVRGGDTAPEGTDYTTVADLTLTIAAGATSGTGTFEFAVTDDEVADPGETVTVSGSAGGFAITDLTLAINDTDTAPTAIVLGMSQAGADEGASPTVTVTATLSPASITLPADTPVSVTVGDSGDSATEGTDYTTVADLTVTIAAGTTSGTVTFEFAVTDDEVADPGETVTVSGSAGGFAITDLTLAITDTDTAPTAIVLGMSQVGADEGASPTVTVTATLSPDSITLPTDTPVSVTVGDSGDLATEGTDYTTVADLTVTIAAGATSGTVTFEFAVTDDEVADPGETVTVSGSAGGFAITDLTLAINDTDTAPTAIVLGMSQAGADEGASPTVTVTATLSPASVTLAADTKVSVTVGDSGDSATEGTDYTPVADLTVTIAAGATSGTGTFEFAVTDDEVADPGETVTVSGSAGGFAITDLTLAINDSDTAPTAIVLGMSQVGADEGASPTVTVTATLSPDSITLPTDTPVSVTVGDSGDSATEGTDYTTVADLTVTIAAGATSGTVTFEFVVTDDEVADPGETVTVSGSAGGFAITDLTLAITDTDTAPTAIVLSLSQDDADEGASATVTVTAAFPGSVTLTDATVVTVAVGAGGDSATEGTDYDTVADLTVTIPAGESSVEGTFQFAVTDDVVADPGETVTVSGTAGVFTITDLTLAINDNDTAPTAIVLSLSQAGADEGASPTITVTATLSPASITLPTDTTVTVAVGADTDTATEGTNYDSVMMYMMRLFQVRGGDTAPEGTDYTTVAGLTLTIEAGATSGTVTFEFAVTDDEVADPGETVTVSGSAGGFAITDLTLAINDTDTAPTVIVLGLSQADADEGASPTVTVTATLSPDSITLPDVTTVSVTVGAGGDSATEGTDYTTVADLTVTIAAGATSGTGTFEFAITDDEVADPGETVTVSGSAGGFAITDLTLAINDTDTAPTVIVLGLSQAGADEGASPTVTVTATLSPDSITLTDATVVTVAVGDSGDSATEGTDYATVADLTVTIAAGATSGTGIFQFAPTDDAVADPDETVSVSGSAVGFTFTNAVLAITDTDIAPTAIVLSLSQAGADEGASPTVTVTATLSPASITLLADTPVSVTVGDSEDSAIEGTDYTTVADLTITIAAGATSGTGTFLFAVTDDAVADPDETVTVSGTAGGFSFTDTVLAITDNDTAPTAIVLGLSQADADEGASPTVTVTATLSPDSITLPDATPVSVTVGAGTDSATEGTDYTTVADFTVTIAAGATSGTGTFALEAIADTLVEGDEILTVSGSGEDLPVESATLVIRDGIPTTEITLSVYPPLVWERTGSGTTQVTVTASRWWSSPNLSSPVEVVLSVGADTDSAIKGTDYNEIGGTITVTIAANDRRGTATLDLEVIDDTLVEADDTLTITGSGEYLSVAAATLVIRDSDSATVTLISAGTVGEGAGTVTITATLDRQTQGGFTVQAVSGRDGTAEAGSDYAPLIGEMLTFAGTAGEQQMFEVTILEDSDVEGDETFTVTLTGEPGAGPRGVHQTEATVTIIDNDFVTVTLGTASVSKDLSSVTVTATLDAAVQGGFTVRASTADGSATAGEDYTAVTGKLLSFKGNAGEEQTLTVNILSDSAADGDETFTVSLSGLSGNAVAVDISSTATVTITDYDTVPTVIVLGLSQADADEGASPTVTVTATLSPTSVTLAADTKVSVAVGDSKDSATEGTDYTTVADFTVTIEAGATSGTGTFQFAPTDDAVDDPNETVTVSGAAGGFKITDLTLAITDTDTAPTVIVLGLSQADANEGASPTVTVTATLSPASVTLAVDTTVSVAVGDSEDSATEGTDYTPVADFTVTIKAGAASGTGSFVLTVTEDVETEDPPETVTVSGAAGGFTITDLTLTINDLYRAVALEVVAPELAQLSERSVVDAVADRIGRVAAGISGPRVSFDGHSSVATALAANEQVLNEGGLDWQEFLGGSSFDLIVGDTETPAASGQAASDGAIGIWASGDYERISSKDAGLGEWEGDLLSAHLGIDRQFSESFLAGLAVSWSKGSFEFDDDESLKTDSRQVALSPYFGWNFGDGAGLWVSVGHGRGEVEQENLVDSKRDLTMAMVAAGGNRRIVADAEWDLDIRGEASVAQLKTEASGDFVATTADVRRLRLALEAGSSTEQESGAHLARSVALGIRHDGGDGDTGLGAELDGELDWSDPASGVTLRATGHVLLAHAGDLEEWGAGGLIRYAPAQAEGRGLSLRMQPSWGRAEITPGQLWEHRVAELESEDDDAPEARLVTDIGWGLPALSGRGLVTPYSGLELSEGGGRVYRLGGRFEIGSTTHIEFGGDRTETGAEGPEHGIDLLVRMDW